MRVVPTGKISLVKSVLSDLSQNFLNAQQTVVMGKFNQFPRSQYIFMKMAFKDEFDNLYIHEDIPNLETLTYRLINTTVETSLTISRVASGKSDNCLINKITIQYTTSQINQFSVTREGLYSIRVVGNTLGTITYPLFIKESKANPNYQAVRGAVLTLRTRDFSYSARAG